MNIESPSPRANRVVGWFIGITIVLCLSWWLWGAYQSYQEMKRKIDAPIIVKTAPEIKSVPKVEIAPIAPVKVYAPAAKAKLKLPAEVQADSNKYVIAASHIDASRNAQTVTTVLDKQTGESETFYTKEPPPLFAVDLHGYAGAGFGFKNGFQTWHAEIYQNLLDIKNWSVGGELTADQPTIGPIRADYSALMVVRYNW